MKICKSLVRSSLCMMLFVIWSCPNQYVGQVLTTAEYIEVSRSGRHQVDLQLLFMAYHCDVNRHAGNITFDGDIRIKKRDGGNAWIIDELRVAVFFMNRNRKVLAVDHIVPDHESLNEDVIPFKKTFKYKAEYVYVTHSYESRASIRSYESDSRRLLQ